MNNALTNFSFAALTEVGGNLQIRRNDSLTNFGFGSLADVYLIKVEENADLCSSVVDEFETALTARGWTGTIEATGNHDGC